MYIVGPCSDVHQEVSPGCLTAQLCGCTLSQKTRELYLTTRMVYNKRRVELKCCFGVHLGNVPFYVVQLPFLSIALDQLPHHLHLSDSSTIIAGIRPSHCASWAGVRRGESLGPSAHRRVLHGHRRAWAAWAANEPAQPSEASRPVLVCELSRVLVCNIWCDGALGA